MITREQRLARGARQFGSLENAVDEKQAFHQWFDANIKSFDKLTGAQVALKAAAHGFSESIIKKLLPDLIADHELENEKAINLSFNRRELARQEGHKRYGIIENEKECSVCSHPQSSHNDYGQKCKDCGCRGYVSSESK